MCKKEFLFFAFFSLLFNTHVNAAVIHQSLYINKGMFQTVTGTAFPYLAFNKDTAFTAVNAVIRITTSDQLLVKVINTDKETHAFEVANYGKAARLIAPGDSIIDTLQFAKEGVFIFFDSYQNPTFRYLGEAGMICVTNSSTDREVYWNLKEHQSSYNTQLDAHQPVSWSTYAPDFFTINSLSYPFTTEDTTCWIHGSVGDTIHIFIANTGQSAHSLHFHGFHCKIISSTNSAQLGWIKDTFPLKSMEAIVLELIPDKLGRYTVHDHNLTAITGGGYHPKGMLTIIAID